MKTRNKIAVIGTTCLFMGFVVGMSGVFYDVLNLVLKKTPKKWLCSIF